MHGAIAASGKILVYRKLWAAKILLLKSAKGLKLQACATLHRQVANSTAAESPLQLCAANCFFGGKLFHGINGRIVNAGRTITSRDAGTVN